MELVILAHFRRYPLLECADLYKLLLQACLGNEHAIGDPTSARKRLDEELGSLPAVHPADARSIPGENEPLLDPISADGAILRVHLRPWKDRALPSDPLLQAFLDTAAELRLPAGDLRREMDMARALAAARRIPLPAEDLEAYFAVREAEGLPAVHHSAAYLRAYAPSYRVVHRRALARHAPALLH
ncbi:MAG: hypothetical protein ACE15D_14335 [Candidatus Eisenbacteria bacterium]|nr:hypothetical protein [Candidatus Eisenbacteria bacterium]